MKMSKEKILRYLADDMGESEKMIFEEELLKSPNLKNQLADIRNGFYNLKADAEMLDERYFNNLLPSVRQRFITKRKPVFVKRIYYLVPYTGAAIIGLLFLFKPTYNFDYEYKDLAGKVVNNMTDKDVATKFFDELDSESVYPETADDNNSLSSLIPSNLDVNSETTSRILEGTVIDEYGNLYSYSNEQLKTIAANLDKFNIK